MFVINNFREFCEWSTLANIIIRELLCSLIHGIIIYIIFIFVYALGIITTVVSH